MMTSIFQLSTSLSSVAIVQHQQRMKLTFHKWYVILGFDFLNRAHLLTQRLLKQGYVTSSLKSLL